MVPDECDFDFDHDGLIDACDPDMDNDGVPNTVDVCRRTSRVSPIDPDGRPTSDANGNCDVDLLDYWRFRCCQTRGRMGFPAPETACISHFDMDADEELTLRDFASFQNGFRQSRR